MPHESLASFADPYPSECARNLLDQTLVRVDRQTYQHFLAVLAQPPDGEGFELLMRAPSPWQS